MLQLKRFKSISLLCISLIPIGLSPCLHAQGYDDTFEMKNKLKVELQYSDYFNYEYPEPIIFQYGVQEYQQNLPYIANFPEKRALIKFTRLVDASSALSMKYQFSDLRQDVNQHMAEAKITHNFGGNFIGLIGGQIITDSRGFNAYQPGIGFRWDISPLTIVQADAQYYMRGEEAAVVGGQIGSTNLRFKIRQVLTLTTAFFVEYLLYRARGETLDFDSQTLSLWLSQFLPTQTALHLNLRVYDNSMGIQSIAPSLEIAQYLNWATVLRLKYRYYENESENVSLGETDVIIPDGLQTHTFSLQINREMTGDLEVYGKYRYYRSNHNVDMNTYLMGAIYSF